MAALINPETPVFDDAAAFVSFEHNEIEIRPNAHRESDTSAERPVRIPGVELATVKGMQGPPFLLVLIVLSTR